MPELCDWNPQLMIPATGAEGCKNSAVLSLGKNPNWHLCEHCAILEPFKRLKSTPLKKASDMPPPGSETYCIGGVTFTAGERVWCDSKVIGDHWIDSPKMGVIAPKGNVINPSVPVQLDGTAWYMPIPYWNIVRLSRLEDEAKSAEEAVANTLRSIADESSDLNKAVVGELHVKGSYAEIAFYRGRLDSALVGYDTALARCDLVLRCREAVAKEGAAT